MTDVCNLNVFCFLAASHVLFTHFQYITLDFLVQRFSIHYTLAARLFNNYNTIITSMVNNIFNCNYICMKGVSPGFGRGGQEFFFRFVNLHVTKRHAAHGEAMRIARGVWGHAPPRNFFKTMQFGAF